ncbi:MAG: carboxypeptidase-like regulatory domain-containing protein [Thermoguttaceae bacterium]
MKNLFSFSLGLICLISVLGCGSSGLKGLAKVEGTVHYNNEPLAGATVIFGTKTPEGRSATGITDENGKFKMTTLVSNDGVMPGEYVVSIMKYSEPDVDAAENAPPVEAGQFDEKSAGLSARSKAKNDMQMLIPERYSNPATSGLTASISKKGEKDLKFDLVD